MSDDALNRAERIWRAARQQTGEPLSIFDLATAVGRLPGKAFGRDLAAARHMALDHDEVISPCIWHAQRKEYVLYHLMSGQEQGRLSVPMVTKIRDVGTRSHNLSRISQWQSKHGSDPLDRKLAKFAHTVSSNYITQVAQLADLIAEVAKRR